MTYHTETSTYRQQEDYAEGRNAFARVSSASFLSPTGCILCAHPELFGNTSFCLECQIRADLSWVQGQLAGMEARG